jgi:hypothetical protein
MHKVCAHITPVCATLLAKTSAHSTTSLADPPLSRAGEGLQRRQLLRQPATIDIPCRTAHLLPASLHRNNTNSPSCCGVTNSSDGCFSASRSCCACSDRPFGRTVIDLLLHQRRQHPARADRVTGDVALRFPDRPLWSSRSPRAWRRRKPLSLSTRQGHAPRRY